MNEDDFYSAGMNEFQKIIQEYQEKFEQSRIEAAMMDGAEVEVGWGKYYGPMVEAGTRKMNAQPHLRGLFKKDSNKYYNLILQRLFR